MNIAMADALMAIFGYNRTGEEDVRLTEEEYKAIRDRLQKQRADYEATATVRRSGRWGNIKKGKRDDLPWPTDSAWEANVGRVLLYMQEQGEIRDLQRLLPVPNADYWLEFQEEHGTTRSILDFRFRWVENLGDPGAIGYNEPDSCWTWVEVKGELDPKSKTRIKRIKRDHPDVWNNTLWIVQRDPGVHVSGYGEFAQVKLPRGKAKTAHAYLAGMGATMFWFIGELKEKFSGLVAWE